MPAITVLPYRRVLRPRPGQTLHGVLAEAGLLDAPCGGQGTCGKCVVTVDAEARLACQTAADRDMTVTVPRLPAPVCGERAAGKRLAFDIGTTGVVCYLVGEAGQVLAQGAAQNPQAAYGADVVSRLRAAAAGQGKLLTESIRSTMTALIKQVCSTPEQVEQISVVGNPAMQQLFLGLPIDNLIQIPFAPVLKRAEVTEGGKLLPICPKAKLLTVPDISGFVGADTVAGMLWCGLESAQELTLLVDIGTNGELVLAGPGRRIACATAAGPALEGASITCGMRAAAGAIDHVWLEANRLRCSVIGGGEATGICGSGLIDAIAAALDLGLLNRRGRILTGDDMIVLTEKVFLTQQDIRQVMLAKGAIRAGIQLLAAEMGVRVTQIRKVVLAGAFGSYLTPENACRIGLLPECLQGRITAAGNAAGAGGVLLAAEPKLLGRCQSLAEQTEFLELANAPAFPKAFAKAMELPEDWCRSALALGFSEAAAFDPAILQPMEAVRQMCAEDTCHAYGRNWTCPPHCGELADCAERMGRFRHGLLVQTVGTLSKVIDSRGYRETEERHLERFSYLCEALRHAYPDALCLGTGGCRLCKTCAYPEPCRFPDLAVSSMEAYGLFVTQVCRDVGVSYHHGDRTITYTACILYG